VQEEKFDCNFSWDTVCSERCTELIFANLFFFQNLSDEEKEYGFFQQGVQ
jgi:hypothetical protein